MNYSKIYQDLIKRGQGRILSAFTEKHHIIPRCLGGLDNVENLVNLTPEEHYLAHLLLVKIYNTRELIFAANMMCRGHKGRNNNKRYGWLKRKLSESTSGAGNTQFGKKLSDERKRKCSHPREANPFFNKKHSDETKAKISAKLKGKQGLRGLNNGMFGKHHSDETKQKISNNNPWKGSAGNGNHPLSCRNGESASFFGKKHSEKSKQKMSLSKKGKSINAGPQKTVICPHCNKEGGISNMKRYHFDNCKRKI